MDGGRFDAITRTFASRVTRRGALKGALAAIGGALLPVGRTRVAWADVVCGAVCDNAGPCANSEDGCFDCCNGVCVNTRSDPYNCGACNIICPGAPSAFCADGQCGLICPDGWSACNGYCADLLNDPNNCLDCGLTCFPGQTCCGTIGCIDLQTDIYHCGACGNACGADQGCQGGACLARCPDGLLSCAGVCVDAASDPVNCGGCGTVCDGNDRCQGGQCISPCAAGTTDCGEYCADLAVDQSNCGTCGNVCDPSTRCQNGTCLRPECPDGKTRCRDGCFDLATDVSHCGGCDNVCISDAMTCCGGSCFDLETDAAHCGACDKACPPGYRCQAGECETAGRRTLSPELCLTGRRPYTTMRELREATPGPISTRPSEREWARISQGAGIDPRPASNELARIIMARVEEFSACGNTGDPARQTGLMTDAMASRWLAEQGFTPDELTEQAAITPLPPGSWEVLEAVGDVYELGEGRASVLATYLSQAPDLPSRREMHIFQKENDDWLLDAIHRDERPGSGAGTVLLRLFDCPVGVAASDPAGSCPAMTDLMVGYRLRSSDGSITRGIAEAEYVAPGLLEWRGLPPGRYALEVADPDVPGVSFAIAGARPGGTGEYLFFVRDGSYAAVLDLYRHRNAAADAELRVRVDDDCPPCHRKDFLQQVCIPTCAPCTECRSADIGNDQRIPTCQTTCRSDQICARSFTSERCCVPVGGACAKNSDCCENTCTAGVCACAPEGSPRIWEEGFCCPGLSPQEVNGTLICTACKGVGMACMSNEECCDVGCFDGVCRCCAEVDDFDYTKHHLCCAYPRAWLKVTDSASGPGFERCCVFGADCPGDPQGPILPALNYRLGWSHVCRV